MMGKVTGKPLYLDKKYPVEFSLTPIHWDPIMTGAEVSGQHYQLQQPPAGLGQGSGRVSKGLNLIWDVCAAITRQTTWVYRMIYAPFYAEHILAYHALHRRTNPPTNTLSKSYIQTCAQNHQRHTWLDGTEMRKGQRMQDTYDFH